MNNNHLVTVAVAAVAGFVAYKLATDPNARQELSKVGDKLRDGVEKITDLLEHAREALDKVPLHSR